MAETTQAHVDALAEQARIAATSSGKLAEVEALLKAKAHHPLEMQARTIERLINMLEDADLAPFRSEPAKGSNGDGIRKPAASNPWSRAGFNATAQSKLVKAIGVEKASAIAAAAGCKIGDTKPNPAFN